MIAAEQEPLGRLRAAAGMTLVVYGFRTGSALLLAWPLLSVLAPVLDRHLYRARLDAADVALVLETVIPTAERQLLWACGCLAGYALLRPLLALAWLHALARPQPWTASLARAASGYPPALALAVGALLAGALSVLLLAQALRPELAAWLPASELIEQACVLGWTGAVLLVALLIASTHDLACAGLATGSRPLPALAGAVRRLSLALLARHALLAASAMLLLVLAELAARAAPEWPPTLLVLLQQACVLAAIGLRGLWLAYALQAVGRPTRPRS